VRFHDLRHTFGTLALVSGVDLQAVSRALGHESAAITSRIYVHAVELEVEATARLDTLLGKTVAAAMAGPSRPSPKTAAAATVPQVSWRAQTFWSHGTESPRRYAQMGRPAAAQIPPAACRVTMRSEQRRGPGDDSSCVRPPTTRSCSAITVSGFAASRTISLHLDLKPLQRRDARRTPRTVRSTCLQAMHTISELQSPECLIGITRRFQCAWQRT
jgi:Phage integrase family